MPFPMIVLEKSVANTVTETSDLQIKLSAQRNEIQTKQFQECFETVLFQFHFVARTV